MAFICASCRRLGGVQPSCRACATVGIAVATFRVPEPMFVSVAFVEPEVHTKVNVPHERYTRGEWFERDKPPKHSFPISEYSYGWDYPPDYPYFEDFKLSKEERSIMKTQVEIEFDNTFDLDIIPVDIGPYWRIRKKA